MSSIKIGLCLFVLALSACRGILDSKNPPPAIKPPGERSEDVLSNYVETSAINFLQTNQKLNEVKKNLISIKGTGTKSTYKIKYSFNSGAFTSFKILETTATTNCSGHQEKMVLNNSNESRDINILGSYSIVSNTDYTLEVSIGNSCKELSASFDMVAWLGNPLVDPFKALICQSNQIGQTVFFEHINIISLFTTVVSKEKFISMNTFCGESFRGSEIECTYLKDRVGCVAVRDAERRSFTIDFSNERNSAQIVCKNAEVETFVGSFFSCEEIIADYNPYKNF